MSDRADLTPAERAEAVASLRALQASIEAGEVESTADQRAYLAGAADALDRSAPEDERDP